MFALAIAGISLLALTKSIKHLILTVYPSNAFIISESLLLEPCKTVNKPISWWLLSSFFLTYVYVLTLYMYHNPLCQHTQNEPPYPVKREVVSK